MTTRALVVQLPNPERKMINAKCFRPVQLGLTLSFVYGTI
jgi:hypothetical protein